MAYHYDVAGGSPSAWADQLALKCSATHYGVCLQCRLQTPPPQRCQCLHVYVHLIELVLRLHKSNRKSSTDKT